MEEQSLTRVLRRLRGNGELLMDGQVGWCLPPDVVLVNERV
jgi:hypothetical protein